MTTDPDSPLNGRMLGTSHAYICDRLRREGHVAWLEAIEAGRVTAYAVACELNWVTRRPTLTGERANQTKKRRHQLAAERRRLALDAGDGVLASDKLTSDQRTFLLYGPDDRCGHAFDTEAQVEAAWQRHREALLACCQPGRRCWAWRVFDRPELPWRGYDHERAILWRAPGVLSAAERIQLEQEWRRDLVRGQESDAPYELRRQYRSKKEPRSEIAQGQQSA